jgi:DNA-binding HxlR family transcriptional regulator
MQLNQLILGSPIAHALAIIGDRWTMLIIRDVFLARRRFSELIEHTGASRGTLSKRLKSLVEQGILYKNPYSQSPSRFEYRLTDKGFALYNFALTIWHWETKWGSGKGALLPPVLIHRSCNHTLIPRIECKYCNENIHIREMSYEAGTGGNKSHVLNRGSLRRSSLQVEQHKGVDDSLFHVADILGDRWTPLVLSMAFMGLQRFDEMQQALTIATNILADRLKLLVDAGVLKRNAYQNNPPRHDYSLTEKGRDLVTTTVSLYQWAQEWLPGEDQPSLLIQHSCCKKTAKIQITCSHCEQAVTAQDVKFPK